MPWSRIFVKAIEPFVGTFCVVHATSGLEVHHTLQGVEVFRRTTLRSVPSHGHTPVVTVVVATVYGGPNDTSVLT